MITYRCPSFTLYDTDQLVRPSKEERERRAAEKKAYIAMRANHQLNGQGHPLANGTSTGETNGSIGGTVGSEEDADGEEE